jgi:hypothetical protein
MSTAKTLYPVAWVAGLSSQGPSSQPTAGMGVGWGGEEAQKISKELSFYS